MRRLETGSLVAALGAALLLVSLFLGWYQPGLTAWSAFEVWDLVLAGLAVAVLLGAAAELEWWRGPVPAVELHLAGAAALVIVAAALLDHPPAATGRALEGGAWLGLGGAVLMAAGGVMARVGISLSVDVEPKPRRRDPAPAAPPAPVAPVPASAPGASTGASTARPGRVPAAVPAPAPSPNRDAGDGRPARAPLFGARRGPPAEPPAPAPAVEWDVPEPPPAGRRVPPSADPAPPGPESGAAPGPGGGRRWRRGGRPEPPVDETEVTRPLGPGPPAER